MKLAQLELEAHPPLEQMEAELHDGRTPYRYRATVPRRSIPVLDVAHSETTPIIDPATFRAPWRSQAACATVVDSRIFWSDAQHKVAAAKKVCASCPVASDCLTYALDAGELGVWGGTTESQRRTMRRRAA